MESVYAKFEECKNIHIGPKIYLTGENKLSNKFLEVDCLETIITDLQGYLRSQYRNRQAWICTQPWASNEECHINDFFIPLDIGPVTLNDQGWFIDRNTVISMEELFQTDRCLHPPKRILIQGESGSGKSTLLRKLTVDWATQKDGYLSHFILVFLLQLKYMDLDIHDALENQILKLTHLDGYKDLIWDYIRKHQHEILFLLDGYDEMPNEYKKTGTFDRLCKGITIPEACVVVSCRPQATIDIMKHYDKKFAVKGFSQNGIDKFVSVFIQRQSKTNNNELKPFGDFLYEFLSCSKPTVKSLTQNPLTLNLLCTLLKEKYLLNTVSNSSRLATGIYLGICHCFYKRTLLRKNKNCENLKNFEKTFKELGWLCLKAVKTKQYVIQMNDFYCCISKDFIHELGLFHETNNGYIEVLHISFIDFLAAFYLKLQCFDDDKCFKQEINEIIEKSNTSPKILPLEMFIFLCGLLQDLSYKFFNNLPEDFYKTLNSHEIVNHLSFMIQECGDSDDNIIAIQKFLPEHLILDQILTLHSFTNIIPGLSMILAHKHCTVKSIIISSDTILSCCLTGRDAFYQLLGGLCRNTSIKSVDVRMFTSYGNFENFSNRENIKSAFREFCQFGLSNKKLTSLNMKCDFNFEDIAKEVFGLLKTHTTLKNIILESTNKSVSTDSMIIERIMDALKDNSNIESLTLKGFYYFNDSWNKFPFILENCKLKHLSISVIQEVGFIQRMKKYLPHNRQNSLAYVSGINSIFKSFSKKACMLECLDFTGTLLLPSDIENLARALEYATCIKSLKLFDSCIKFKHLHPILYAISESFSVVNLFIGCGQNLYAKDVSVRLICKLLMKKIMKELSFRGITYCISSISLLKDLIYSLNRSHLDTLCFIQCSFVLDNNSNLNTKKSLIFLNSSDINQNLSIRIKTLKSLYIFTSVIIDNEKINCIKQIEAFKHVSNLKELNLTGDSTIIEDSLFKQFCCCLSNFQHLESLILQSCRFQIDDDDVCINAYKLNICKIPLKWIEFKGCSFESKDPKKTFFSQFAIIILNTQNIRDFLCSWVNLFGSNHTNSDFMREFLSSLKITHSVRIHVKNWPKDFINDIFTSCKSCSHLRISTEWDKMHELDCLLLNPP